MNEEDKLSLIKDILLTDDREFYERISKRIIYLEETLEVEGKLSKKVNPIIKERLKEYTASIPETLGSTITETLKKEIKNSRDEVVDALFPILGKMVKKYVAQEVRIISEKINERLNWRKRIKNKINRTKTADVTINQVLLIEKKSGLLVSSFSKTATIDEEMISGMLTAIKLFIEDAFLQKKQNLELIEYENYKIHLQSFVTHYLAIVISGDYSLESKDKLQNIIFDFYENYSGSDKKTETIDTKELLAQYFNNVEL